MSGRVEIDHIKEALERLGLSFAAEALPDLVNEAVKDELPPHALLANALRVETENREERRVRTSLRLSGLPPGK
ncbi:MAG: hypothetical protein ACLFOY_18505, partial [Desulfatibacillaceae bacterium]